MHHRSLLAPLAAGLVLASLLACGGAAGGGGGPSGPSGTCQGHALAGLAPDHLLLGAAGDGVGAHPGFDLEYHYISGGLATGSGPCARCDTSCEAISIEEGAQKTHSCANSDGCAWWGCWQYDQDPPGTQYGSAFAARVAGQGRVPMFTYYQLLQSYRQLHPSFAEGTPEPQTAAADAAFMSRYLADFRFLLQRIGTNRALVHVEPDFWGYAQQLNGDPNAIPAAVATANATDCAAQANTVAGLGRCMIAMVRKYAPNAWVGLHASAWATRIDVLRNTSASFDVAGEGAKIGAYLAACGPGADVVVVDIADRDADDGGYWLRTDDTLPSLRQALVFAEGVSARMGKPVVWWQVPVGNMSLANTNQRWKDNRLDWFLDHAAEVAQRGAIGVAFGGGQWSSTTPDTDGGHLYARAAAYGASGGQGLCR